MLCPKEEHVLNECKKQLRLKATSVLLAIRYRVDLWLHVLKGPEPLPPKPRQGRPIVHVTPRDSILEIIGTKLLVNCGAFQVWIDEMDSTVEIRGCPVELCVHYSGNKPTFTTERTNLRFDSSEELIFAHDFTMEFGLKKLKIRWREMDIRIDQTNPSQPRVDVRNATILGVKGRLTGIGPDNPIPQILRSIDLNVDDRHILPFSKH